MATPEQEPQAPPEVVQHVETRFRPEVERQLQEVGAQVRPSAPPQIQDSSGQVIAQPVVQDPHAPPTPSITVPFSEEEAVQRSHGKPSEAGTWYAITILRRIHIAFRRGLQVFIGSGKP